MISFKSLQIAIRLAANEINEDADLVAEASYKDCIDAEYIETLAEDIECCAALIRESASEMLHRAEGGESI